MPKETAGARRCNLATCGDEVQCDVSTEKAMEGGCMRHGPEMSIIVMCMVHVCNETAQIKDVVSHT